MSEGLKQQLAAGIVLTGGAAQIPGLVEVAEKVFDNIQVRIGKPQNIQGLAEFVDTAAYSTAVGLLRYKNEGFSVNHETIIENPLIVFFNRIKSWIKKEY
ncbi:hypothetical protein [Psychromonas sp. MME2]|uniref:hypothetical protein n=1 Tax=Psychromonas sp. MME2 TaxID=3231033 RepID=UPI00339C93E3